MDNKEKQELNDYLLSMFDSENLTYKQYKHLGKCKTGPCDTEVEDEKGICCAPHIWHIHASNELHILPKHPNCDCYYEELAKKALGTISNQGSSPDLWLKIYGKLPDYYITKAEAKKYGWNKGKKLSNYVSGKMIGGDIYYNSEGILPSKPGRIWNECDVDYIAGERNNLRLYYSNDGLMFYSPNHLDEFPIVYWIQ